MTLEIKFRAWDKFDKCIIEWDYTDMRNLDLHDLANHPDYVFMQFTGLHDKNGVEIYEGDIVIDVSSFSGKQKRVGEIKWKDGAFIKHTKKILDEVVDYIEPFHYSQKYADKSEIIGNIHTNPELIK